MFTTMFGRTGLIMSLYGVVFDGEFDGDVQKCAAPLEKQFLSIVIHFYRYLFDFCDFLSSVFF